MSKEFDKEIKEKLNNIPAEEQSDWEEFSKILDEEFSDKAFDEQMASKIQDNYVPYEDSHWEQLKRRMDEEDRLIKGIKRVKVMELVAVFMLLLVFLGITGSFEKEEDSYFADAQKRFRLNRILEDGYSINLVNNRTYDRFPMEKDAISSQEIIGKSFDRDMKILSKSITSSNYELISFLNDIRAIENTEILELDPIHNKIRRISEDDDLIMDMAYIKNESTTSYDNTNKSTSLGIYTAANKVQINTPFDKISNIESYSKSTSTNEYGFYVSQRIGGKIGYSTGLSYYGVVYVPKEVGLLDNSLDESESFTSITSIEYDIISIPAMLKWGAVSKGKLGLDLLFGIKSNFIMHSEYDVAKSLRSSERFQEISSTSNYNVWDKKFIPGIIDGGNVIQNLFVSFDLELGISYRLDPQFKLNFSPRYSRHVLGDGIGPNRDKIHTASFKVGLEYLL